jgi:hypothetical protein
MLGMDALDLSFSNLIQIIKMRTAAGFIPSFTAGTRKTQDRSNPPVTATILHKITQRWGAAATQWVVELCFEDLFIWNTWMWAQRTETPLRMLAWGSSTYTYVTTTRFILHTTAARFRGCTFVLFCSRGW